MGTFLFSRKKPVGFELSSDMHKFYAFNSHIYLFSFMTTYIFLVLQIYYFFLRYANNFGNCKHMHIYTKY